MYLEALLRQKQEISYDRVTYNEAFVCTQSEVVEGEWGAIKIKSAALVAKEYHKY